MYGLTVRWSLVDAPKGTLKKLRAYVEEESFAKFAGLDGLRVKTWRARKGEWDVGRAAMRAAGCEIVAVVRGPAGFRSSASFEHDKRDDD